jgi:precorrin-8X/cobalt-precorrin-8 methylmutase
MNDTPPRPLMKVFMDTPLSGPEIEAMSMAIIDREAPAHAFRSGEWQILRRMIHTVGDFGIIDAVRFSPDAIEAGVKALKGGRTIFTDANMIRAGISLTRLRAASEFYRRECLVCHVADDDVVRAAKRSGLPRSLHAVQKARPLLDGAIVVIGNAPVALMEICRMIIDEGIRPSLVVAMPVGFVHVAESKEELMSLGVPFIATAGRRGGSPLAVSVIHALCGLAAGEGRGETKEPSRSNV